MKGGRGGRKEGRKVQTVICSWNYSGTRLVISRSRFTGPASVVNNQFQPFSKEDKAEKQTNKKKPKGIKKQNKPLPKESPQRSKFKLLETKKLKVTRLQHRCPKLLKEGFTVRRMDPAQTGF